MNGVTHRTPAIFELGLHLGLPLSYPFTGFDFRLKVYVKQQQIIRPVSALPIDTVLPELFAQLSTHSSVVLSAEPVAGKTTRVPIALLNAELCSELRVRRFNRCRH